ncbi:hypothetical protein WJX72_006280 [[Myrmecia] bisecta]|uniref:Phosducin domain-containing protein n=1 Tax=[Myrmecia] bisecta TaxID=41462 RepID=A0AAW1Q2A2_9CHLO
MAYGGDSTVYKGLEGETTQWEDLQRKHGNLPPKEPIWKPDLYTPEKEEVKDKAWIDSKEESELAELENEFDDDRFLENYRKQRLQELKQAAAIPKYGTLEHITASEFVQQVTNAGEDVWVVVHLYKDKVVDCAILGVCLQELAGKYPHTKFVKIISTDCIPRYPDQNLPTVLVYKDKQCIKTLIGLAQFGGRRVTPEHVAFALNRHGPICRQPGDDAGREVSVDEVKDFLQQLVVRHEEEVAAQKDGNDSD